MSALQTSTSNFVSGCPAVLILESHHIRLPGGQSSPSHPAAQYRNSLGQLVSLTCCWVRQAVGLPQHCTSLGLKHSKVTMQLVVAWLSTGCQSVAFALLRGLHYALGLVIVLAVLTVTGPTHELRLALEPLYPAPCALCRCGTPAAVPARP